MHGSKPAHADENRREREREHIGWDPGLEADIQ